MSININGKMGKWEWTLYDFYSLEGFLALHQVPRRVDAKPWVFHEFVEIQRGSEEKVWSPATGCPVGRKCGAGINGEVGSMGYFTYL